MADCSTFEEMIYADQLGFDYIATTLFGYTSYSSCSSFKNMDLFNEKCKSIKNKIIVEGKISTPDVAKELMNNEFVYGIVVGGAITRPQEITTKFTSIINS